MNKDVRSASVQQCSNSISSRGGGSSSKADNSKQQQEQQWHTQPLQQAAVKQRPLQHGRHWIFELRDLVTRPLCFCDSISKSSGTAGSSGASGSTRHSSSSLRSWNNSNFRSLSVLRL
mmetsp:Transcript_120525/g.239913  ORF Transcript_120525/g.239913 Transcript_120525/m.239913 type:complete len:118 (-) Transcript_120525:260-613(-)